MRAKTWFFYRTAQKNTPSFCLIILEVCLLLMFFWQSITSNAEMSFLNPQEIASVCSKPRKDEPKRHYEP
jgi:hypothetical protein